MKKHIYSVILLFSLFFLVLKPINAFEITDDPQYIVVNFSDTFHFLDWSANEDRWLKEVRPKAVERLRNIKTLLTVGSTPKRRLAWSTLLEYTNYPLDKISDKSPYIIRVKRMMELAEKEDLPIFIPLNGIQWWDELPELWNWWDFDGNQTPGCTNGNYAGCGFEKLRNPEYRKRFIAGYNPENKWNVDWQDWKTPMKFNVRNWGSGDIFVAPPPNIIDHGRNLSVFAKLQKSRYEAIVKTIIPVINRWEKENKRHLFAGISIGTEVTLNASVKSGDDEFRPYGYRAIQDIFCPKDNPVCGTEKHWTSDELESMRQTIISRYFFNLVYPAWIEGIPKQRIYTHVWSEAEPGDIKYNNAIGSSVTLFSRPGLSLYGNATNPLGFKLLYDTLKINGFVNWAAPEFAPLNRDAQNWHMALNNTLNNRLSSAKIIDVYNEADILNTSAISEIKSFLTEKPLKDDCFVSETVPLSPNKINNPKTISWKTLEKNDGAIETAIILWPKNSFPVKIDSRVQTIGLEKNSRSVSLPKLERGFYFWAIKRLGCDGGKWTISTPRLFYNFPAILSEDMPFWVKAIRNLFAKKWF